MNHMRYLSDNQTVCMEPDRLKSDWVFWDADPDSETCRECRILVTVHLEREEQADLVRMESQDVNTRSAQDLIFLRPFHGMSWALLLSIPVWAVAILIFVVVWWVHH